MQRFSCPFCGLRDEREFHFAGEAGKVRPDTTQEVSGKEWSSYMFDQSNPLGISREIWVHLPCHEYFIMERDTSSMAVLNHQALRKGAS